LEHLILIFVYFVPTILALVRRQHNFAAVVLLNLFLGWTLIGWVAALIGAFVKPAPSTNPSNQM